MKKLNIRYSGTKNNNGHKYPIVPALVSGKINLFLPSKIVTRFNEPKTMKSIIAKITQKIDIDGIALS
jgi:hypothetical protein